MDLVKSTSSNLCCFDVMYMKQNLVNFFDNEVYVIHGIDQQFSESYVWFSNMEDKLKSNVCKTYCLICYFFK